MIRLFAGYDAREAAGYHVFAQSVLERCVLPPPIHAVGALNQARADLAELRGDGSNDFTYARFSIPERCGFEDWALFVDASDMLLRADLAQLFALADPAFAVQVVQHDYRTRHPVKYVGTPLECANPDYPRKNWSSVMLLNCGHPAHRRARDRLRGRDGAFLHRLGWLRDDEIGALPPEWNWLADEYGENDAAKLLHWTAGIPGFRHYEDAPHAAEWHAAFARVRKGAQRWAG